MSRTKRNHSIHTDYHNVEGYANRYRRFFWHADPGRLYGPVDVSDWYKWSRDGKSNEGSAHSDYRKYANKLIRGNNRKNVGKLLKDQESYDDMDFATKAHGKHIAWAIW